MTIQYIALLIVVDICLLYVAVLSRKGDHKLIPGLNTDDPEVLNKWNLDVTCKAYSNYIFIVFALLVVLVILAAVAAPIVFTWIVAALILAAIIWAVYDINKNPKYKN